MEEGAVVADYQTEEEESMSNRDGQGRVWIASGDQRVRAWFGSHARKLPITVSRHTDIVPGDIFVGDTKQPKLKFYGGGFGVSDADAGGHRNSNRLQRGSTDPGRWLRPANIFIFTLLFLQKKNRDSFIGDLEERFGIIVEEKGRRAATRWFWREIRHSFLSLTLDGLKKLSGLEKLMERYRRIGS